MRKAYYIAVCILAGILLSGYAGVNYLAPRSSLEELEYLSEFHRPGDSSPIKGFIESDDLHDIRDQLISVPSLTPCADETAFRQGLKDKLGPHNGKILLLTLSEGFDPKTHHILSQVAGECGVGILYLLSTQSLTQEWIPQDDRTQLRIWDYSPVDQYHDTVTRLSNAPVLPLDFGPEKPIAPAVEAALPPEPVSEEAVAIKNRREAASFKHGDFSGIDLEHFVVAIRRLSEIDLVSEDTLRQIRSELRIDPWVADEELSQKIFEKLIENNLPATVIDLLNGTSYQNPYLDDEISKQSREAKPQSILEAISNGLDANGYKIGQFGKGIKQILAWLEHTGDRVDVYTKTDKAEKAHHLSIIRAPNGGYYISIKPVSVEDYKEAAKKEIGDEEGEKMNRGTIVRVSFQNPLPLISTEIQVNSQETLDNKIRTKFPFVTDVDVSVNRNGEGYVPVNGFDTKNFLVPHGAKPGHFRPDLFVKVNITRNKIAIVDNGRGMDAPVTSRMFVKGRGTKGEEPLTDEEKELEEKGQLVHDKTLPDMIYFSRNGEVIRAVKIPAGVITDDSVKGGMLVEMGRMMSVPETRDSVIMDRRFQKAAVSLIKKLLANDELKPEQKIRFINSIIAGMEEMARGNNKYETLVKDIRMEARKAMEPLITEMVKNHFVFLPHDPVYQSIAIPEGKTAVYLNPYLFNWQGVNLLSLGGEIIPQVNAGGTNKIPVISVPFAGKEFENKWGANLNLSWHTWPDGRRTPIIRGEGFVVIPSQIGKRVIDFMEKQKTGLTETEAMHLEFLLSSIQGFTPVVPRTDYEIHEAPAELSVTPSAPSPAGTKPLGEADAEALGKFLQTPEIAMTQMMNREEILRIADKFAGELNDVTFDFHSEYGVSPFEGLLSVIRMYGKTGRKDKIPGLVPLIPRCSIRESRSPSAAARLVRCLFEETGTADLSHFDSFTLPTAADTPKNFGEYRAAADELLATGDPQLAEYVRDDILPKIQAVRATPMEMIGTVGEAQKTRALIDLYVGLDTDHAYQEAKALAESLCTQEIFEYLIRAIIRKNPEDGKKQTNYYSDIRNLQKITQALLNQGKYAQAIQFAKKQGPAIETEVIDFILIHDQDQGTPHAHLAELLKQLPNFLRIMAEQNRLDAYMSELQRLPEFADKVASYPHDYSYPSNMMSRYTVYSKNDEAIAVGSVTAGSISSSSSDTDYNLKLMLQVCLSHMEKKDFNHALEIYNTISVKIPDKITLLSEEEIQKIFELLLRYPAWIIVVKNLMTAVLQNRPEFRHLIFSPLKELKDKNPSQYKLFHGQFSGQTAFWTLFDVYYQLEKGQLTESQAAENLFEIQSGEKVPKSNFTIIEIFHMLLSTRETSPHKVVEIITRYFPGIMTSAQPDAASPAFDLSANPAFHDGDRLDPATGGQAFTMVISYLMKKGEIGLISELQGYFSQEFASSKQHELMVANTPLLPDLTLRPESAWETTPEYAEAWKTHVQPARDRWISQAQAGYSQFMEEIQRLLPSYTGDIHQLMRPDIENLYQKHEQMVLRQLREAHEGQSAPVYKDSSLAIALFNRRMEAGLKRLEEFTRSETGLRMLQQSNAEERRQISTNLVLDLFTTIADENISLKDLTDETFELWGYGWSTPLADKNNEELVSQPLYRLIEELKKEASPPLTIMKIIQLLSEFSLKSPGNMEKSVFQVRKLLQLSESARSNFISRMSKAFEKVSQTNLNAYTTAFDRKKAAAIGPARSYADFFTLNCPLVREDSRAELQGNNWDMPDGDVELSRIQLLEEARPGKTPGSVMPLTYLKQAVEGNTLPEKSNSIDSAIVRNVTVQREAGGDKAEITQNSIDATKDKKGKLVIDFFRDTVKDEFVEEVTDNGTGALSETALLIEKSMKKEGDQIDFAGTFGTGKFTVFNDMDRVEIISSNKEGRRVQFFLEVKRGASGEPVTVVLTKVREITEEIPEGVTVRRIKRLSNSVPELEQMIARDLWRTFAGMACNENFQIFIKDYEGREVPLMEENEKTLLSEIEFAPGKKREDHHPVFRVYSTKNMPVQVVEARGLRVCNMREEYLEFIPPSLRHFVDRLGLVVQVPLPLIRTRDGFIDEGTYLPEIKKYVAIAFYQVLANKALKDPHLALEIVPADLATEMLYSGTLADPKIITLAKQINNSSWGEVSFSDLKTLFSADQTGIEWNRDFVKLIALLNVPLDWSKPNERTSLLEQRRQVLKAVGAPTEEEDRIMGEINTADATQVQAPVNGELINIARGNQFQRMLKKLDSFIIEPQSPEDHSLKDLAETIGNLFGLEQVLLMDSAFPSACFTLWEGKKTLCISQKYAASLQLSGNISARNEALETIVHEIAHLLEQLKMEQNEQQFWEKGFMSHDGYPFTHEAKGPFGAALEFASARVAAYFAQTRELPVPSLKAQRAFAGAA